MTSTTTSTWISSISGEATEGEADEVLAGGILAKSGDCFDAAFRNLGDCRRRHLDRRSIGAKRAKRRRSTWSSFSSSPMLVTEIYIINNDSPDVYKITWMFFVGAFRL
jgi:hypothetical protein